MKSVCKHVTNSHQNNTSHRLKEQTDLGSERIRHMASGGLVYHRGNHKHEPSLEESDSASAPLQQYRYCKVTATFPLSYWYTNSGISLPVNYDDVTVKLGSLFSMINGRQSTTCILSVTVRPQNAPLRKCNKPLSHTHIQANSPSLSVFSWHCTKSDFACRHQCGRVCVCVLWHLDGRAREISLKSIWTHGPMKLHR